MALFLDLESLASLLDEEPETDVEAEEQEPVNSYLLHEVLPLLELGLYPRLADIDYDEFECYHGSWTVEAASDIGDSFYLRLPLGGEADA